MNEQRWLYVFLCALTLGHSILAGYPQLSLYLYFFLGVYLFFELLSRFRFNEFFSRPALVMTAKAASIVVLSVALSAGLALAPLMIGADAPGKEILHPVAITIFGGLISSTLLDTLLTPVLFLRYGQPAIERLRLARNETVPGHAPAQAY